MSEAFRNDCVDCGRTHETFHAYTSYRCPDCVGGEADDD